MCLIKHVCTWFKYGLILELPCFNEFHCKTTTNVIDYEYEKNITCFVFDQQLNNCWFEYVLEKEFFWARFYLIWVQSHIYGKIAFSGSARQKKFRKCQILFVLKNLFVVYQSDWLFDNQFLYLQNFWVFIFLFIFWCQTDLLLRFHSVYGAVSQI